MKIGDTEAVRKPIVIKNSMNWAVFDIPANIMQMVTNAGNVKLNLVPIGAMQSVTDYRIKGHGFHGQGIPVVALKT